MGTRRKRGRELLPASFLEQVERHRRLAVSSNVDPNKPSRLESTTDRTALTQDRRVAKPTEHRRKDGARGITRRPFDETATLAVPIGGNSDVPQPPAHGNFISKRTESVRPSQSGCSYSFLSPPPSSFLYSLAVSWDGPSLPLTG